MDAANARGANSVVPVSQQQPVMYHYGDGDQHGYYNQGNPYAGGGGGFYVVRGRPPIDNIEMNHQDESHQGFNRNAPLPQPYRARPPNPPMEANYQYHQEEEEPEYDEEVEEDYEEGDERFPKQSHPQQPSYQQRSPAPGQSALKGKDTSPAVDQW